MINEEQYVSYFKNLAIDHKSINHNPDLANSFFYIEEPDDMDEFDNALRNCVTSPVCLLMASQGELMDNNSENHTQEINGQLYIIAKTSDNLSRMQVRALCMPIVLDFLAKMKIDARANNIINNKLITFRIDKIPYQHVGPINLQWFGYTVWFTFICPFGFTVSSSSWRSIT